MPAKNPRQYSVITVAILERMATLLEDVRVAIRTRLDELRPVADEYEALERAAQALSAVVSQPGSSPERPVKAAPRPRPAKAPADAEAPYGRKADGTPRQRPGRRRHAEAQSAYERAAAAAESPRA